MYAHKVSQTRFSLLKTLSQNAKEEWKTHAKFFFSFLSPHTVITDGVCSTGKLCVTGMCRWEGKIARKLEQCVFRHCDLQSSRNFRKLQRNFCLHLKPWRRSKFFDTSVNSCQSESHLQRRYCLNFSPWEPEISEGRCKPANHSEPTWSNDRFGYIEIRRQEPGTFRIIWGLKTSTLISKMSNLS
jgi:hypothetical protein